MTWPQVAIWQQPMQQRAVTAVLARLVLLYYVDPEDPVSDAEGVRFRAACTNEYSKWRGSVSP